MLKFKYNVDAGSFMSIKEFEAYLDRMGNAGYELVSYKQVDRAYLMFAHNLHPRKNLLYFETCWKKECTK